MAVLRCIKALAAYDGGRPRVVRVGALVREDDPIVKGRRAHFESVEQHLTARRTRRTEQATAAPGEPRTVTAAAEPKESRTDPPPAPPVRRPYPAK